MASRRRGARGAAAVFVVVALAALIGMVALVLNLGHRWDTRAELQNAADAAALAGARELNGTLTPILAGLPASAAIDFAGRHTTEVRALVPVVIGQADVQLGHWDPFAADPSTAFAPITTWTADSAWNANAVRVLDGRELVRGNPLVVWLGAFLGGATTQNVVAEAVAVNGGPCQQACPTLPFAFSDCLMPQDFQSGCGGIFHTTVISGATNPDPSDTMGFTSLNVNYSASTPVYRDILSGANCAKYEVQTNQPIPVSNGSNLVPLCTLLANWLGVVALVPVVHAPCPPKFNQAQVVMGFASVTLVGACGCPNIPTPPAPAPPCVPGVKRVDFQLNCNQQVQASDQIGCGFFGTAALQPKLVR